jgi:hypothetical protein
MKGQEHLRLATVRRILIDRLAAPMDRRPAYDVMWKSLFHYKFYELENSLSAAWLGTRIKRVALSRKNIFQERLGYLAGGSEVLLEAIATRLRDEGNADRAGSRGPGGADRAGKRWRARESACAWATGSSTSTASFRRSRFPISVA